MSSNESRTAEPSGGGKGIFIALIPWIVFTVLASHATLKIGSLAALATAIAPPNKRHVARITAALSRLGHAAMLHAAPSRRQTRRALAVAARQVMYGP